METHDTSLETNFPLATDQHGARNERGDATAPTFTKKRSQTASPGAQRQGRVGKVSSLIVLIESKAGI